MLILLKTVFEFSPITGLDLSSAWQLNARDKENLVSNISRRIKSATSFLNPEDLFLYFGTEKAGLRKVGKMPVNGTNSHREGLSANLSDDFQLALNIKSEGHTFSYEIEHKQTISTVSKTPGFQALNAEFAGSNLTDLFRNSSVEIHSLFSDKIVLPFFPLTSHEIIFSWNLPKNTSLRTNVYQSSPIAFDSYVSNIQWSLNHLNGLLWINQSQFSWTGDHEKNNILGLAFTGVCCFTNMNGMKRRLS